MGLSKLAAEHCKAMVGVVGCVKSGPDSVKEGKTVALIVASICRRRVIPKRKTPQAKHASRGLGFFKLILRFLSTVLHPGF
jgi:hypothetical protein